MTREILPWIYNTDRTYPAQQARLGQAARHALVPGIFAEEARVQQPTWSGRYFPK